MTSDFENKSIYEFNSLFSKRELKNGKYKELFSVYKDKVILITGGGGSIGSEICRQIAKCAPKLLIVFDIYENGAFDLQQELVMKYGSDLNIAVEIGSVRDTDRLYEIFALYKPNIVFHAAAHKHVPLMENNPSEAVKNNIFGTYNVANAAEEHGAERFILISTDKAVNPTGVMGATKRFCEMIIGSREDSNTVFSTVRFGNVIGSNGSVLPLFKKQIDAGGPLTITDKRVTRYFMTIPEACQLVMCAGAISNPGDLFMLNMGEPLKIYDLAVNMIREAGLQPGTDIEIIETGLRPGEKLCEELVDYSDSVRYLDDMIILVKKDGIISRCEIEEKLKSLQDLINEPYTNDKSNRIRALIKALL